MANFTVTPTETTFSVQVGENTAAAAASAASIQNVAEQIQQSVVGPITPAPGTAISNLNTYFWPLAEQTFAQVLQSIEVEADRKGTLQVVVATVNGDGTLTRTSLHTISVVAGSQTIAVDIDVPANSVVGLRNFTANVLTFTSGTIPNSESVWITTGLPTTSTAKTVTTSNGPNFRFTLSGAVPPNAARGAQASADLGVDVTQGWNNIVGTGSNVPAGYNSILPAPAPEDGFITSLEIGSSGGTAFIVVLEMDPATATVSEVVSETPITLSSGLNTLALDIPIAKGQFYGVRNSHKFQVNANNNPTIAIYLKSGGAIVAGDTLSPNISHRYEINFTIQTGLKSDISKLAASASSVPSLVADNTGATDTLTAINAALSTNDHVYVPRGEYLVSALPQSGNGLWGPGKLMLSGKEFFLPNAPMQGSVYEAARRRLAWAIGTGAPVVFFGNSITHVGPVASAEDHYLEKLTSMLNIEHSPTDVPMMTALTDAPSYTTAFAGVTYTGTIAGGSRGPIGSTAGGSVVMSAGAVMSFTGALDEIGFAYTQEPGAGTVTVARDGTTIATIDANGTLELDAWSGDIASGSTSNATYTLTVSGGDVEITALRRLGVRAATDVGRLNVMRVARGSFSIANFNADEIASIAKIASHLSSEPPIVFFAFGINSAATISTAAGMRGAMQTRIDLLKAQGVLDFIGWLPMRPSEGSWATRSANFDAVVGGLSQVYRDNNVQIIANSYDYLNGGKMSDGLHPDEAGHDVLARTILNGLAG